VKHDVALCYQSLPRATTHPLATSRTRPDLDADVIVVGAGVIGLSIAWRAARSMRVAVVDPSPGSGASDVAAGMLAPVTEMTYGEDALGALTLESAALYPQFVADVESESGVDVGHVRSGTLTVALDRDDLSALDDLYLFLRARHLDVERLSGHEARRVEPLLAPDVRGALLVPSDHQVDPRRLVAALRRAGAAAGAIEVHERVEDLITGAGAVTGVRLAGGRELRADAVVLAAGASSPAITARVEAVPVRPVKGQLLVLRAPDGTPFTERTVRGLAHGFAVYLVPRRDGRVIVGATVEERGFDSAVTADAVYTLLRDSRRLVPASAELELVECRAGLRPATPDNAPLLGAARTPGLVWATGHYRNGVLLAPITALAIERVLAGGELPEVARPFVSARFERAKVSS